MHRRPRSRQRRTGESAQEGQASRAGDADDVVDVTVGGAHRRTGGQVRAYRRDDDDLQHGDGLTPARHRQSHQKQRRRPCTAGRPDRRDAGVRRQPRLISVRVRAAEASAFAPDDCDLGVDGTATDSGCQRAARPRVSVTVAHLDDGRDADGLVHVPGVGPGDHDVARSSRSARVTSGAGGDR